MQQQISNLLKQLNLPGFAWNLILLAAAILFGLIIKVVLTLLLKIKARETNEYSFFRSAVEHLGKPFNYFLPLLLFNFSLSFMEMPPIFLSRINKAVEIGLIITFSWILTRSINIIQAYVYYKYDLKKSDNLRERKIRTQLLYIRQVIVWLIIFLTIAAILLSFNSMRKIGAGLLTSVGIGGIIIGFAAQKSLANLLAGFQIAFTQPIRIDDVVVVEGEFGRVEEITLTYVVVHIWDERRLILPITYFIEKPFQNWTRTTAELLSTVFIYTDYTIPIEPLRKELTRLLKNNPLWDGKVNALQVTDTNKNSMQLRFLISAKNSGNAFDLQCYVRENMINYIKENYPAALPKTRAEINTANTILEKT